MMTIWPLKPRVQSKAISWYFSLILVSEGFLILNIYSETVLSLTWVSPYLGRRSLYWDGLLDLFSPSKWIVYAHVACLLGTCSHTCLRLDGLSGISWPFVDDINHCYGKLLYGRLTHWCLEEIWMKFQISNCQANFYWSCLQMEVAGPYRWEVNISSGNGLMSYGNKPLPELLLTQIYVAYGVTKWQWVKYDHILHYIHGLEIYQTTFTVEW